MIVEAADAPRFCVIAMIESHDTSGVHVWIGQAACLLPITGSSSGLAASASCGRHWVAVERCHMGFDG